MLNDAAEIAFRIDPKFRARTNGELNCSCPNKAGHGSKKDRSKSFSIRQDDANQPFGVSFSCFVCDPKELSDYMFDSGLINKPEADSKAPGVSRFDKTIRLSDAERQALEKGKKRRLRVRAERAKKIVEGVEPSESEAEIPPDIKAAVYHYNDEDDRPYVRVVRWQWSTRPGKKITPPSHYNADSPKADKWDKGLIPHYWDEELNWVPNPSAEPLVVPLMRVAEVLKAAKNGGRIYLLEGEGKAEILNGLGMLATCHIGGSKKPWLRDWTLQLMGAEVIVVCDNDETGFAWGRNVCNELIASGIKCKLIFLPDLKNQGDDIKEYLQAHKPADFIALVKATEYYGPEVQEPSEVDLDFDTFYNTDMSNAERLVRRYGHELKNVSEAGLYFYNGKRYEPNELQIFKYAKQNAKLIYAEAEKTPDGPDRKALFIWAKASESRSRLEAAVELAKADITCSIKEFDRNPLLLNCQNGVVDLLTGRRRNHSRELMLSRIIPVTFNPSAKCPVFDEFLKVLTNGDDVMIAIIWRAIGYTLSGLTDEEVMFFLYGDGQNGKSKLIELLFTLMGTYANSIATEALMMQQQKGSANYELAPLVGARLVSASETELGQRLAESFIKRITGGETIICRHPHKDFFSYKPEFKIWMSGNYKPSIKGTDKGIRRRLVIFPCDYEVPEHKRDRNLFAKISAELSGILNKGLEGFADYYSGSADGKKGLRLHNRMLQCVDDYFADNDSLGFFLAEKCIFQTGAFVRGKDLYQAYIKYCNEIEQPHHLSDRQFYENIEGRKSKGIITKRTNIGKWFKGIGLKGFPAAVPSELSEELAS